MQRRAAGTLCDWKRPRVYCGAIFFLCLVILDWGNLPTHPGYFKLCEMVLACHRLNILPSSTGQYDRLNT